VAVALAQIGEFSFILAALGRQVGVLADTATNALVTAAIVSICLNPLLYRLIDPLEAWTKRRPRIWRWLDSRVQTRPVAGPVRSRKDTPEREAIVVGYGPVGRTLTRLLHENGIEPTVIELNLDTVRRRQAEGAHAVYGDAMHRETLRAAGVERAVAIVLTSAGMRGSEEVIRLAREENPKIRVFARTAYLREIEALRQAGADAVFSGEGEVALTMTEFVLRRLGATDEQIDRERDRIRTELFRGPLSAEPLIGAEARPGAEVSEPSTTPPAQ
jgi:CPA2 family monovalent cation:H+ antiporter-2